MSNHRKVFVNQPSGRHYSQLLGGLKIVPLQQNVTLRPTTGIQTKLNRNLQICSFQLVSANKTPKEIDKYM